MAEELTGTLKAAAFHGVATNRGYRLDERLQAALQALDIYEAETERVRALHQPVLDAVVVWHNGMLTVSDTGAEAVANSRARSNNRMALQDVAAWFIANGGTTCP